MKTLLILFLNLFLLFSCKQGENEKITQQTKYTLEAQNQDASSDSIPIWQESKLGSNFILKKFPEHWSYPSITSDNYDESSKNKFNLYLEEIGVSYNTINDNKGIPPITIPDIVLSLKDDDFEIFDYPIALKAKNLSQLYKLNGKFFVALFQQENDKPIKNITKRIDLIVFDFQSNIIDKTNILIEGYGDQHAFMKYFHFDKGILQTRIFYVYDGESSASSIKKYEITNNGKIIVK